MTSRARSRRLAFAALSAQGPPPPPFQPEGAQVLSKPVPHVGILPLVTVPNFVPPPPPTRTPPTKAVSTHARIEDSVPASPAEPSWIPIFTPQPPVLSEDGSQRREQIMATLRADGVFKGIFKHWNQIEQLHKEERFSCKDIAWIFHQCSLLKCQLYDIPKEGEAGLGTKVVTLFSDFVCHRVPELPAEEITCFVGGLISQALPMDEFWLFILAKRIQDTVDLYTPEQVSFIGKRYADRGLEDDEFFEALTNYAIKNIEKFPLPDLADLLLGCAKIRFLSEELCQLAFPKFQDRTAVANLDGATNGSVVTAAALLDWRDFHPLACCYRLINSSHDLKMAVSNADCITGLALAAVYFRQAAGIQYLMPFLLQQIVTRCSGRLRPREVGILLRRTYLVALCAAFGVPYRSTWSPAILAQLRNSVMELEERFLGPKKRRDTAYEPESSSFHLEVAAILRLLEVENTLEHRQLPFVLDIFIRPDNLEKANIGAVVVDAEKLQHLFRDDGP